MLVLAIGFDVVANARNLPLASGHGGTLHAALTQPDARYGHFLEQAQWRQQVGHRHFKHDESVSR